MELSTLGEPESWVSTLNSRPASQLLLLLILIVINSVLKLSALPSTLLGLLPHNVVYMPSTLKFLPPHSTFHCHSPPQPHHHQTPIICVIVNGIYYPQVVTLRHAKLVVGVSTGLYYAVREVSNCLFTIPSQRGT